MTKSESLVFGLTWLTPFNAKKKYKQNINIFVKFYYHDLTTKNLKETGLFILDKTYLNDIQNPSKNPYNDAFNAITVKNIFPNQIMDYFCYTDNKTKIPKEYEKLIIKKGVNQTQLSFF